jgi:hypothetical protein
MTQDPMRYSLQLEMLEQDGVFGDEHAIELLRSEFALAQNAGRFDKLTARDIRLGAMVRETPQEGVTRYVVDLLVEERTVGLDDERAEAVLCDAITGALNASYFLRVCEDALRMQILAREPAAAQLRYAA